ncbi:carboxypeptidase-like regulatory domain-containing protein [Hymenobacter actinosclerus]|nr:carboxypeptidase-like regulatory domain-containing protein [Hymenobacter actinosclerus]
MYISSPFKTIGLLLLLLAFASVAQAQTLTGTVTEAGTAQPVPYVNIGIPGKTVGTVADEQGRYQLTYTGATPTDTVRLSSIGYTPRWVLLRELAASPHILLTPAAVALADVRVQAPGLFKRSSTLGNTGNSQSSTITLEATDKGAEIGTVINLRHKPTKVLSANFNMAYNRVGSLTFRVNLYRLLPNGRPSSEKLLQRDLIVTTSQTTGPVSIDLTTDQLVLDEDFFLALEWIGGADAGKVAAGLAFSASVGYRNNELYMRPTSQAAWERASAGAFLAGMQPRASFYVTALD